MTTPIVSRREWAAAHAALLVKEKAHTRARDALAAERRRMPWLLVEKDYAFDGPAGRVSLLELFEGRRQLVVYRAFFEPGVHGWPDHACTGCSLMADQVADVVHLHARNTTFVYASRAPQPDIARFTLGPHAGRAEVSTRMRLATSQKLAAVARLSDGSYWQQTVDVIVTIAACIEDPS